MPGKTTETRYPALRPNKPADEEEAGFCFAPLPAPAKRRTGRKNYPPVLADRGAIRINSQGTPLLSERGYWCFGESVLSLAGSSVSFQRTGCPSVLFLNSHSPSFSVFSLTTTR